MTEVRFDAIRRLGAPICAHCNTVGPTPVVVEAQSGPPRSGTTFVRIHCCSAICGTAVLDGMWSGTCRKRVGKTKPRFRVIATKAKGQAMGIWAVGRKTLVTEHNKRAKVRTARAGENT